MPISNEIWKSIEGYTGYQVSNLGQVKSFKINKADGKIMRGQVTKYGYRTVDLYRCDGTCKTKRVHRLVAQAFLFNYSESLTVNHIDGNKQNNNITNLEMMTIQENIHHYHTAKCFDEKRELSQKQGNNHQRGQIYVTNGIQMKRIYPSQLDEYLSIGWYKGISNSLIETRRINATGHKLSSESKDKIRKSQTSLVWITDGQSELRIRSEDIEFYLNKGFRLGQSDSHKFNNHKSNSCRCYKNYENKIYSKN